MYLVDDIIFLDLLVFSYKTHGVGFRLRLLNSSKLQIILEMSFSSFYRYDKGSTSKFQVPGETNQKPLFCLPFVVLFIDIYKSLIYKKNVAKCIKGNVGELRQSGKNWDTRKTSIIVIPWDNFIVCI